MELCFFTVET